MILTVIGSIIAYASSIYTLILLARVILDWTRILAPRWMPSGGVLTLIDWVYRLTDPPLKWLRKFIPPLRLGNIALDVGFIVVFVSVALLGRFGQYLIYLGLSQ